MAIGDRCQSAKTYLEKNFETFDNASLEDLIKHGIEALRASAQDVDLTEHNVSVGVVGADTPYRNLTAEELRPKVAQGDVDMIVA
jgi:20S proteasome subunit alpha 6